MTFTHALATNNYGSAKFIVATSASNGTHTTLTSAMAAASSGDTIFLRNSVTENVTLTPGVNIAAWTGGSANTPSITGKLTMTGAGTCTISGIELITNSDFFLAITGSANSNVNLNNCYLNCLNNTGISLTTSGVSAGIVATGCNGNIGTTGITLFTCTSASGIFFQSCFIFNSGSSTTASTTSTAGITLESCAFYIPLSCTSTGFFSLFSSDILNNTTNTICVTTAGSATTSILNSHLSSGSASAISIGVGTTVKCSLCSIDSTNTNAITGAGTIFYSGLAFIGSSQTINTTTQNTKCGTLQGSTTTAPSAGFLGEQIRSAVGSGTPVNISNNIAANVTSINLTAGVWDVSGIINFKVAAITGTAFSASISTTSATVGTEGDNNVSGPTGPTSNASSSYTIPSYRLTLTTTTTVYLVGFALYSVGSLQAYGRISGTRVG